MFSFVTLGLAERRERREISPAAPLASLLCGPAALRVGNLIPRPPHGCFSSNTQLYARKANASTFRAVAFSFLAFRAPKHPQCIAGSSARRSALPPPGAGAYRALGRRGLAWTREV
jgi:hypothetical protein